MSDMSMAVFEDLLKQASFMLKSGFLPDAIKTPEQAVVIKMYGDMLGMHWLAAMQSINVISGKPTLSPQGMIALARREKLLADLDIQDDGNTCTVTIQRVGHSPKVYTFSMDDARQYMTWDRKKERYVPLAEKQNWTSQPSVMRQWRAVGKGFRVEFSDLIHGFYPPEEMDPDLPVDADGNIVGPVPSLPTGPTPPKPADPEPPRVDPIALKNDWVKRVSEATGLDVEELIKALGIKRWGEIDWLDPQAVLAAENKVSRYLDQKVVAREAAQDVAEAFPEATVRVEVKPVEGEVSAAELLIKSNADDPSMEEIPAKALLDNSEAILARNEEPTPEPNPADIQPLGVAAKRHPKAMFPTK